MSHYEENNDEKITGFDICYAYAIYKCLILKNIRSEKDRWFNFQDSNNDVVKVKHSKSDSKAYKFSIEKGGPATPEIVDENKLDVISLKKTINRYKSIMERNYTNDLNYLLFEFFCKIQEEQKCIPENEKISKKDNKDSFNRCLEKKNICLKLQKHFSEQSKLINQIKTDELKKAYKNLYNNMSAIRTRNWFYDFVKDKCKYCINKYEEAYYKNYQSNILLFEDFNEFWNPKNSRTCGYCGVNEDDIEKLEKQEKIRTKRFYSRGKTMEIDKIEADGEYEVKNIILACYWCNNAKTDEYNLSEFEEIARGINAVWSKRLAKNIEFPEITYKNKM